jgi:hypothetical protein
VTVAKVTCTLGSTLTALCPTIVDDFLARATTG